MSKLPFLYKFATPLNPAACEEPQLHYDVRLQANVFEDGTLSWHGLTRRYYTNVFTTAHKIPGHRNPSNNNWINAKVVKSKTDRRVGK